MQIPFGRPMIGPEEKAAVAAVLESPQLVHGPKSHQFEHDFAAWTGAKHALSLASCTAGLHLYHFAQGYGPGAEVIVPAETHTATAHAVEYVGAKPVFVDVERNTGNIDPTQLEAAITPRTKAISVVHYLGLPVDMDPVMAIAAKHGLPVLEDAALAFGTYYNGVHAGLIGDAGVFSFYPVKHMTTAEGGMLITNNDVLAGRIASRKAFGYDKTLTERKIPGVYDVTHVGFNYRMNEIEAAIGIEQLKKLKGFIAARKENDTALRQALAGITEIELLEAGDAKRQSSYYCLVAVLNSKLAEKRPEIMAHMTAAGVGTSVYYPHPVPYLQYYREKYGIKGTEFPNAARISYQGLALPVGPHLEPAQMAVIATALKNAIQAVK